MNYVSATAASKAFDLHKKGVLPSAKMDQNKVYQELMCHLEMHEAKLTIRLLPAEHSMLLSMHQLDQCVDRNISSTNTYQTLLANLLHMQIETRQLELQVENHTSPTIKNHTSPTIRNHTSPTITCMFMPDKSTMKFPALILAH
ncbi:hypothetical protein PGT21_021799 [Puccinia graminis f. sp. tritici]|uniref:Uncharacterized protein n=1 Tax=Puccinia graminis f. sp. tritici TaxID=56615 RepID=A0A5B0RM65_PUCGR|nr:hypothetical protein PGT21_021799 [Puccinia graminis f. sp. tritici]KAA1127006.1 hypothetical protein PGTUg99_035552 [Puccinia graminis f. sp. tritici]